MRFRRWPRRCRGAQVRSTLASILRRNDTNSPPRCRACSDPVIVPLAMSSAAYKPGVPLRHDDRGRGGELPASTARSRRSIVNDMLTTELLSIRNRIRELRREKAPRGRRRSRQRNRHSQTPRWRSSGWRLSSTKGRHSTCDGRSSAYSSRRVVCGSVTGCDPQAPSTLWIVIIRQCWRNSMLHSASCLEFVCS
jgi:hypothetical protein